MIRRHNLLPIEDPSEVWDEQERLDLNVQYQLPWGFNGAVATVYLNANNLTDKTDVRFHGTNFSRHGLPRHGFPRRRAGMRYGPPALALAGPPAR